MDFLESISVHRIAPPEVHGKESIADLIDQTFSSYNAGRLREVCRVFTQKFLEPDCTVGLSVSGALTPAGLGLSCLIPLIKAGFVDWIVSTGANLYHDTHYALDLPLHQSRPNLDDHALRRNDVIRIYDIVFDYKTLLDTDLFYRELIKGEAFARPMGTAEFHHEVGRYLSARALELGRPAPSLLAAAFEADVPIYTSSPGDSSIGMNLAALSLEGGALQIDALRDVNETAAIVYAAKKAGGKSAVLILGGGSPKNFILQTEPQIQEVLGLDESGHDYFLQITDARPDTGGLSGATASEAMTWGKVDPDTLPDSVTCYTDSTIALPLLTAYARSRHAPRPLRRLYRHLSTYYETLRSEYQTKQQAPTDRATERGAPLERGSYDRGDRPGAPFGRGAAGQGSAGNRRVDLRGSHPHVSTNLRTALLKVDPDQPDPGVIDAGARLLEAGGLVAFATETVYGLGAIALMPSAVAKIFAAKGRPPVNPLIVHVAGIDEARACVASWPDVAECLARRFWPGPLTLVLPRTAIIPDAITAGKSTVAVRVPAGKIARALIERVGQPIAAPSANRSNRISPTRAQHVLADLGGLIDLVIDSGPTALGLESTVLDLTTSAPRVLRSGPISRAEIEDALNGRPVLDQLAGESSGSPSSPGQMPIHYAPQTPSFRVERCDELEGIADRERIVLIAFGPLADSERASTTGSFMLETPEDAARQLYDTLHDCDACEADAIVVVMPPDEPRWRAVRDRLLRATRPLAERR